MNPQLPWISFCEVLLPEPGWRVDHAILATYSADLVVLVSALVSLSGRDLDQRGKCTRVDLIRAMDSLRGRVRILAQAGRISLPKTPPQILGLLDEFVREVKCNEEFQSWHPKATLVRYVSEEHPGEVRWRLWIGSRNLTRARNWESGIVLVSRSNGRGDTIPGIGELGRELAYRAGLQSLSAAAVEAELAGVTWDCPPGVDVRSVRFLGPKLNQGLPACIPALEEVWLISPFMDRETVRTISNWGTGGTKRTLLSIPSTLDEIAATGDWSQLRERFEEVFCFDAPILSAEGLDPLDDQPSEESELIDGEDPPPSGLHAKLIYCASGKRRQLWLGSANATGRAWGGRNYEVVVETEISKDQAEAFRYFLRSSRAYQPPATPSEKDEVAELLEAHRNRVCGNWHPTQRVEGECVEVFAGSLDPVLDPSIKLEVASLGGGWKPWPRDGDSITLGEIPLAKRSHFIQVRLVSGDRMCVWIQLAPFDPPLAESRNRAAIAQYLTPQAFLLWLRSLLDQNATSTQGTDWDSPDEKDPGGNPQETEKKKTTADEIITIEEILRAWARDPRSLDEADRKMMLYLTQIEQYARESGKAEEADQLRDFFETWSVISRELRGTAE